MLKIEFIWEENDIRPGIMVCKPKVPDAKNDRFIPDGWTAKWTFKICYELSRQQCHLVCITDGMIGPEYTPAELAERLNKDGMIPMPHSWLKATIDFFTRLITRCVLKD